MEIKCTHNFIPKGKLLCPATKATHNNFTFDAQQYIVSKYV